MVNIVITEIIVVSFLYIIFDIPCVIGLWSEIEEIQNETRQARLKLLIILFFWAALPILLCRIIYECRGLYGIFIDLFKKFRNIWRKAFPLPEGPNPPYVPKLEHDVEHTVGPYK